MRAFKTEYHLLLGPKNNSSCYFILHDFSDALSPLFVCVIMLPPFCIHILDALLHFALRINMKGS